MCVCACFLCRCNVCSKKNFIAVVFIQKLFLLQSFITHTKKNLITKISKKFLFCFIKFRTKRGRHFIKNAHAHQKFH
jgi:hypothetical protein